MSRARNRRLEPPGGLRAGSIPTPVFEATAIAVGVLIFLVSVLPNLANYPTPTDDEIWVMSAAYKLAEEGVFGSDMFAGFFNADQHYYFNMPLHHVAIAGAFKVLGAGILQARLVGVVYGLATLLLAYLLARRLYGVPTAILSLALLLFLRFNIGFDTGLPLQELAVNMRYDLAPVPFMLGGLLVLLGGVTLPRAAVAGVLFGLATLMQFYGAFAIPVALAFVAVGSLSTKQRLRAGLVLAAAAAVVCLPYGAYVLANRADFDGQAGTIDRRADFDDPAFYLDNLQSEPDRFLRPLAFREVPRGEDPQLVEARNLPLREAMTRRPSAKLAVIVGLPAALLFAGWRWRLGGREDALLFLALSGLVLQYALLEATKFYIYWIAVVPLLCIGIAAVMTTLLRPRRETWPRAFLAVAATALLLAVIAEGTVARLGGIRNARDASSYAALAERIQEQVPPGARVVGATSLWWGLRDTDYRSYFLFFYLTRPDAGEYGRTIPQFLEEFDAEYIVLTRIASQELEKHLSPADLQAWHDVLSQRATPLAHLEGDDARLYGYVDIWRLQ